MPVFSVNRGTLVTEVCAILTAEVTEFNLVKPYEGEIDRYSKRAQVQSEIFPAQVNLITPFALVISKSRPVVERKNRSMKLRHDLSIYIGVQNTHDLMSTSTPAVFDLLTTVAQTLDGRRLIDKAGELTLVEDGEYLITTDLFTVYDQRFYQLEVAY